MAHPNEELLRKGYDAFSKGDFETLREIFDPNISWHVPGKSQLAGDYNGVDDVFGFFAKIAELSGGNFGIELHDVIANDTHAVVLAKAHAERDGKTLDDNNVHVWHVEGGRAKEFWGHSSNQYAVDEFWG